MSDESNWIACDWNGVREVFGESVPLVPACDDYEESYSPLGVIGSVIVVVAFAGVLLACLFG